MTSEERKKGKIDPEQKLLIENAQRRIKQKKGLTTHFVVFIAFSIIFIILNLALDFGKDITLFGWPWFVWAILLWFLFIIIHTINVFIVNKLMGKEWEEKQFDRLVAKQQKKIIELQKRVDKEYPLPTEETTTPRLNHPDSENNTL